MELVPTAHSLRAANHAWTLPPTLQAACQVAIPLLHFTQALPCQPSHTLHGGAPLPRRCSEQHPVTGRFKRPYALAPDTVPAPLRSPKRRVLAALGRRGQRLPRLPRIQRPALARLGAHHEADLAAAGRGTEAGGRGADISASTTDHARRMQARADMPPTQPASQMQQL